MADSAPLLAPGVVIAETYEIDRQLGRGGMGEVWLARHTRLAGKWVAVKVLHVQGNVTQEALARFRREAEIAARLEHPNIVQVLDFNTLPTGEPFLVMELLKGTSLAERVKGGPLPLELVQQIVRQVGSALQTAHRGGVVHRDLKPENIFLTPTALGDQVKVLDFGISKLADSKTVQTTDSVLIGTPLYMSPEQATGNNSDITPQSDLFSLGSICYELLTGEAPFTAESVVKVVFRIAYQPHRPLREVKPELPPHVSDAVEHALMKERHTRTPDIDAFVQEFTLQPLGNPGDGKAGVFQPGMQVSESLMSGKTLQPNFTPPPVAQKATPGAGSVAPPAPPKAAEPAKVKTVSGRTIAIGLMVVGLVVPAGVITLKRWWATQPVPVLDGGVEVVDAGAAPPAPAPDASVATVEPADAGVAVARPVVIPDAGKMAPVRKATETFTAEELEQQRIALAWLKQKQQAATQQPSQYEDIRRAIAKLANLKERVARTDGVLIVIDALCHQGANLELGRVIAELKEVAPNRVTEAQKNCEAVYDGAKNVTW
jgi:serine/threonine-protein kinase